MTNQKAENDPNERDSRLQSPKRRFVKFGILIVSLLTAAILLYISGVFSAFSLYLSQWWTSISPKSIESILSIVTAIFLGIVPNAIWDLIKFVVSQRRTRYSNNSGVKTEKQGKNPPETQISGTNNELVISGDNNIIKITQIIITAYDLVGKSLGTSQVMTRKVIELLNEIARIEHGTSVETNGEKSMDDFRTVLQSAENQAQETESPQIMNDLSNILTPIISKYSKYQREHNYPYAEFCGEYVEALKYSTNIRNAFTATPLTTIVISGGRSNHHGRNTAIRLRILSKLLRFSRHFGDYYLAGQDESYGLSHQFDKMCLCVLGKLKWQKRLQKAKNEKNGSWLVEARLGSLEFNERYIMLHDQHYEYDVFNYPYPFKLDWDKFSTFVTGLTADFILISSGTVRYDLEFNEKMNHLFGKLVKGN